MMSMTRGQTVDIPMLPILSIGSFGRASGGVDNLFRRPGGVATRSGRHAIAQALRYAGAGPGREVLVPAYHCRSMVQPVEWLGATPRFYRLREDLTIDTADLESAVGPGTVAILCNHLFGWVSNFSGVRELCSARNLTMIEDCAHSVTGSCDGHTVGSQGDYVVASPRKFFPLYDGGTLHARTGKLARLSSRSLKYEAWSLWRTIEVSVSAGRLRALAPLVKSLRLINRRRSSPPATPGEATDGASACDFVGDARFDAAASDAAMSLTGRLLLRCLSWRRVAERRRANYARLAAALSDIDGIDLLHQSLPDDVVPYVLPVLLRDGDEAHRKLWPAGVKVWRWDELATERCQNSLAFSERLIQVPVHQELSDCEIDWIAWRTREILD